MQLWQQESDWDYYCSELGDELTLFPQFQSLFDLWNSKRKNDFLPAWKDFSFEDFTGWHKHLVFYEIKHAPFDLHYRIFGSFPTELFEVNCTGATMRGDGSSIEDDCDIAHFQKLYEEKKFGASTGSIYWRNKDHIHITVLDLPLSSDGENVTHFLSCVKYGSKQKTNPISEFSFAS